MEEACADEKARSVGQGGDPVHVFSFFGCHPGSDEEVMQPIVRSGSLANDWTQAPR
jgi:hypothetical protein